MVVRMRQSRILRKLAWSAVFAGGVWPETASQTSERSSMSVRAGGAECEGWVFKSTVRTTDSVGQYLVYVLTSARRLAGIEGGLDALELQGAGLNSLCQCRRLNRASTSW